jgi:S-adenosylmethionine:tRNA ribosyltransferase-isomerase
MLLSEFDYHLPAELIAQKPLEDRADSRMLVLDRRAGTWEDRTFRDLPRFLGAGDCLVLNDTRVFPCRLFGQREGKERPVEILLLRPVSEDRRQWRALVRPGRRLHPGARICFSERLVCEVLADFSRGERLVLFHCDGDLDTEIDAVGHVPLPPYITRPDLPQDRERYQTVFAGPRGSAAAPTAGLHFTPEVLAACAQAGAAVVKITLHVGLGTFQPLALDEVEANRLHSEMFEISMSAASAVAAAKRVMAVGTTTVRTLEAAARRAPGQALRGETDIFIYPGYQFRCVGALLTNFHLPRSSLLLLVASFAGRDLTLAAYEHAVREQYRFFSYGDCMLIV